MLYLPLRICLKIFLEVFYSFYLSVFFSSSQNNSSNYWCYGSPCFSLYCHIYSSLQMHSYILLSRPFDPNYTLSKEYHTFCSFQQTILQEYFLYLLLFVIHRNLLFYIFHPLIRQDLQNRIFNSFSNSLTNSSSVSFLFRFLPHIFCLSYYNN